MRNIKSGSIGINVTHSQDTAVPCPTYHSGATGIDIIPKFIGFLQRFTAGMLRPYRYICTQGMFP